MKPTHIKRFQKLVWRHFKRHGRDLPWRRTTNPYHILVSEIMLQQTQVARVIPKYGQFIARFPTLRDLDRASTADVLKTWQGLGYNRRALALKKIAAQLSGGTIPRNPKELEQLPGIGPYTAGAIAVFAYNKKAICIETNIRRVFLHHFFPQATEASDDELVPYIEQTLPLRRDVRTWYWALMDYGSWLGNQVAQNPNRKSAHYTRQSKFEGSYRQLRGAVLRVILAHKKISPATISRFVNRPQSKVRRVIAELSQEGLLAIQ